MKTLEELLERANNGLVSIDAELKVGTGYDQMCDEAGVAAPEDWQDFELLPATERVRLADRMLGLWERYRAVITETERRRNVCATEVYEMNKERDELLTLLRWALPLVDEHLTQELSDGGVGMADDLRLLERARALCTPQPADPSAP